jgi:hypothetical protein
MSASRRYAGERVRRCGGLEADAGAANLVKGGLVRKMEGGDARGIIGEGSARITNGTGRGEHILTRIELLVKKMEA